MTHRLGCIIYRELGRGYEGALDFTGYDSKYHSEFVIDYAQGIANTSYNLGYRL